MRIVLKRARHFITCNGRFYGIENEERVRNALAVAERLDGAKQLSFFDGDEGGLLRKSERQTIALAVGEEEKRFLLRSTPSIAKSALDGQF
jgi:hypothetical protein